MAQLLDIGTFSIIDTDSSLGIGWKVNTYVVGTTTRQATYPTKADAVALTNANSNPLVVPSDGRIPTAWFNGSIKLILTDENDVVKETVAEVPAFTEALSSVEATVIDHETRIDTLEDNALTVGTHTIPVLAGSMTARTTLGAASGTTESATNKVMLRTFDFDNAADEFVQVAIPMPKSWDEGTVTVQFIWSATATGNVVWGAQAVALSDDDVIDTAFGTAQTVTDGVTATTDIMQSAFTSAITVAGTPAAEDLVFFQFYRDADNASDTCAVDAKLIAVRVNYTVNAANDA